MSKTTPSKATNNDLTILIALLYTSNMKNLHVTQENSIRTLDSLITVPTKRGNSYFVPFPDSYKYSEFSLDFHPTSHPYPDTSSFTPSKLQPAPISLHYSGELPSLIPTLRSTQLTKDLTPLEVTSIFNLAKPLNLAPKFLQYFLEAPPNSPKFLIHPDLYEFDPDTYLLHIRTSFTKTKETTLEFLQDIPIFVESLLERDPNMALILNTDTHILQLARYTISPYILYPLTSIH